VEFVISCGFRGCGDDHAPEVNRPLLSRHTLFVGLLALFAASWFAILLTSQTHVHSDEAIIGLMGKHILEGRYFPFYMYGQAYNAGAAWEAYLAAIAFALFGVGVIPLKGCIVLLSLLCLFLFYRMCLALYDQRTALLATIVFALTPSLLKWHFQVRGYSWYFLSIPLLTILLVSIQSAPNRRWSLFLLFGVISGLSIWSLELGIAFNVALWVLILMRRSLSLKNVLVALAGFIAGYSPAIVFNLTHHFANWNSVLEKTGGGGVTTLYHPETLLQIFATEMPKFFGADTMLWYYPEKPAAGFVFYMIALLAVGVAVWPFLRSPSQIVEAIRGGFARGDQERDLLLLLLISACFVPYVTAPFRVPGYFLGGSFFFAALTGRLLARCFASSSTLFRFGAAGIFATTLITGAAVMLDTARHNQIETLTLCDQGENYCLTRVPGADLDGIERRLSESGVTGVWTTVSFVYPLLFECHEAFAVSDTFFGYQHRVYPESIPWREPDPAGRTAIVLESDSPFRAPVEKRFELAGVVPLISEYGKLSAIEGNSR
jgi:4-amino-4-deoxy-L-arabinose transferase-like glycosyltransferase